MMSEEQRKFVWEKGEGPDDDCSNFLGAEIGEIGVVKGGLRTGHWQVSAKHQSQPLSSENEAKSRRARAKFDSRYLLS